MESDWNLWNVKLFPIPELAAMCCGVAIENAEQAILECMEEEKPPIKKGILESLVCIEKEKTTIKRDIYHRDLSELYEYIEEEKSFIEKDIYCHPLIPELRGMCIDLHAAIERGWLRQYVGPNTTSLPTDRRSTIRDLKEFIVRERPDLIHPPLFTEAEAGLKTVCNTEAFESLYHELTAEKEARKQLEAELAKAEARIKKLEADKKGLRTIQLESFQKQVSFLVDFCIGKIKGAPFANRKKLFEAVKKEAQPKDIKGVSESSLGDAYNAGCRLRQ